ncbi:MAG: hypothetical protein EBZ69_05570 [Alphaproteobacteria bacterium]|nr:hypothetical protein [Alphaproteobacteria bacterium]NDC56260.1 hypothetical protein [Alphaproteobacteria bacterium]NDG04186.1 hypothetical protein [Alphaproteobacteria bacterium]
MRQIIFQDIKTKLPWHLELLARLKIYQYREESNTFVVLNKHPLRVYADALCRKGNSTAVEVFIQKSRVMNALGAFGEVWLTQNILMRMAAREIAGVLGHEIGHNLFQRKTWMKRPGTIQEYHVGEYLADAISALLVGKENMAAAIRKIIDMREEIHPTKYSKTHPSGHARLAALENETYFDVARMILAQPDRQMEFIESFKPLHQKLVATCIPA